MLQGERAEHLEIISQSAVQVVATMVPPTITQTRSRRISDNRAGRGANQTAHNRSTGRFASQAANKRVDAATDQSAAHHAIVPPVHSVTKRPAETRCLPAHQPPGYRRLRSVSI
jgi:hypothetical protein